MTLQPGLLEVILPVTPLFRAASKKSALETQLLRGQKFLAESTRRGWAKGRAQSPITGSNYPGYAGYVPVSALQKPTAKPNYIVTALSAPVFSQADIKSPVLALWPMNVRVCGNDAGGFIKTNSGFLHARHVGLLDSPPDETDYVSIAERHMGRPYIWGGVSPLGLDCSGLVQSSMRAAGRDTPRDAKDQMTMGREIAQTEALRRGDLIFWCGHVGIMQDAERLLHANAFHMCVKSESLSGAAKRISTASYGPITARRRLE